MYRRLGLGETRLSFVAHSMKDKSVYFEICGEKNLLAVFHSMWFRVSWPLKENNKELRLQKSDFGLNKKRIYHSLLICFFDLSNADAPRWKVLNVYKNIHFRLFHILLSSILLKVRKKFGLCNVFWVNKSRNKKPSTHFRPTKNISHPSILFQQKLDCNPFLGWFLAVQDFISINRKWEIIWIVEFWREFDDWT